MRKGKITTIICLSVTMIFVLSLVFLYQFLNKYELDCKAFDATIELDGDVNVDDIKIYNSLTNKQINSDEYKIVKCDDTTTIGEKTLIIRYKDKNYTVHFSVKYKIEFLQDNNVINTQYVNSATEIVLPDNPIKSGYEFIGWDKEIPTNLEDNIQFNAIFSSLTLEVPILEDKSVDYDTSLKDINLASNENGSWVFVDDLSTKVGNVGKHEFNVKFVPATTELVEQFSKITINVKAKKLLFNITNSTFTYDGEEHFPSYTLPQDVKVNVLGNPETEVSETPYEYALIIDDDNYYGSYYGEFSIEKASVVIKLEDKEVDYNQSFEMNYTVEGFKNIELLNISITTLQMQVNMK